MAQDTTKKCSRCEKDLPAQCFYMSRSTKTGLSSYCKSCDKEYKKNKNYRYKVSVKKSKCYCCGEIKSAKEFWKDSSKKKGIAGACISCEKNRLYMQKFGITEDEYQDMLTAQGGVCAICFEKDQVENQRLSVDHDHESGEVRALLCGNCNKALGLLKDNLGLIESAMAYLIKHGRK